MTRQSFLVKAIWPTTAITLRVEARDEEAALEKARKMVFRMVGGVAATGLKIVSSEKG